MLRRPVAFVLWAVGVSLVLTGCATPVSRDPVADEAGQALNMERLAIAVDDLNAVKDPAFARATGTVTAKGCTVSDGSVFEPAAFQEWALRGPAKDNTDPTSVDAEPLKPTPEAQQAMNNIAAQLVERGWSGKPRVRRTKADQYVIDLHKTFPGYEVELGLQGFDDTILAAAFTTPTPVCESN